MANDIIYPPGMDKEKNQLLAVYSILEQMRQECNRVNAIAHSDWQKYATRWSTYNSAFTGKQFPLLQEQNRLREILWKAKYTRDEWKALGKEAKKGSGKYKDIWGDKQAEKVKPTLAASHWLDELLALDFVNLIPGKVYDPTEVLNAAPWVETDPQGYFTVTASRATQTNIPMVATGNYVYRDRGVGHFQNFSHLCTVNMTAASNGSGSYLYYWGLANVIGDFVVLDPSLSIYIDYWGVGTDVYIHFLEEQTGNRDSWDFASLATDYYLTISRVGAAAVCQIRTGSHVGVLVDTLTFVCQTPGVVSYRYGYAGTSNGTAGAPTASGYLEYLDYQEGGAGGKSALMGAKMIAGKLI